MKGFILSIFVFAAVFGGFVLVREDHRIQQCRSAGFDGYSGGDCVYKSRYINLRYTSPPERAAEWMMKVKRFEEDERLHKK